MTEQDDGKQKPGLIALGAVAALLAGWGMITALVFEPLRGWSGSGLVGFAATALIGYGWLLLVNRVVARLRK